METADPAAFAAQVQAKVQEALQATREHDDAEGRQRGALRAQLAQIDLVVERRFSEAARTAPRQLHTEARSAGDTTTRALAWRAPEPQRALRVSVDLHELRLVWSWDTQGQTQQDHEVPVSDLAAFDPAALVLKLIDPGPWLAGRLPDD